MRPPKLVLLLALAAVGLACPAAAGAAPGPAAPRQAETVPADPVPVEDPAVMTRYVRTYQSACRATLRVNATYARGISRLRRRASSQDAYARGAARRTVTFAAGWRRQQGRMARATAPRRYLKFQRSVERAWPSTQRTFRRVEREFRRVRTLGGLRRAGRRLERARFRESRPLPKGLRKAAPACAKL